VQWSVSLPARTASFDRILCGAAIWQMDPLPATFETLAALLRPGGALCFNVPATYLVQAEEPGGGNDPLLLSLPTLLAALSEEGAAPESREPRLPPLSAGAIDGWLKAAGLRGESWSFRVRFTQDAYADWLKIPVVTNGLFGALSPLERARRIDAALSSVDRTSWKWEHWRGWTAWKY
jgi:hypothetical protein